MAGRQQARQQPKQALVSLQALKADFSAPKLINRLLDQGLQVRS